MTKSEKDLLTQIVYQWDYLNSNIESFVRSIDFIDDDDALDDLTESVDKMISFIKILRDKLGCGYGYEHPEIDTIYRFRGFNNAKS